MAKTLTLDEIQSTDEATRKEKQRRNAYLSMASLLFLFIYFGCHHLYLPGKKEGNLKWAIMKMFTQSSLFNTLPKELNARSWLQWVRCCSSFIYFTVPLSPPPVIIRACKCFLELKFNREVIRHAVGPLEIEEVAATEKEPSKQMEEIFLLSLFSFPCERASARVDLLERKCAQLSMSFHSSERSEKGRPENLEESSGARDSRGFHSFNLIIRQRKFVLIRLLN
jgi:hypothetical protein